MPGKPIVVSTWDMVSPTEAAWKVLEDENASALDAVVAGCTEAELNPKICNVGLGAKSNENGEVRLDAMVMDGDTMKAGAVGNLPGIAEAAQVARAVMEKSHHTILTGEFAAQFAESCGFTRRNLRTVDATASWEAWKAKNCEPNFRRRGLWRLDNSGALPQFSLRADENSRSAAAPKCTEGNHDTIGIIALDSSGSLAVGVSTNGLNFMLPGRLGDSAIPGAGGYVNSRVGGAVETGDGDVMMRFLLSFRAVEEMRQGATPTEAAETSLKAIQEDLDFTAALLCMDTRGGFGGACIGTDNFAITVRSPDPPYTSVVPVKRLDL